MPTTTLWQALARESLRDDLEWQHRQLTQNILSRPKDESLDVQQAIDHLLAEQELLTTRWKQMVAELNNHNDSDTAIFSIAIRELSDLGQATSPTVQAT